MTEEMREYYRYENIPCRVTTGEDGSRIAEGYFAESGGYGPISLSHVTWYGEPLTAKAFNDLVTAQTIGRRKGKPV